jgi:hypothetical protein
MKRENHHPETDKTIEIVMIDVLCLIKEKKESDSKEQNL